MGRFIQSQRESSLGTSLVGLLACIIVAALVSLWLFAAGA
jgi:hypothetical protein